MREDIRLKKYRMIHKKVNDMYCNEFLSITQCCKKLGITPSTYYKICKELGKRSVGTSKDNATKPAIKKNAKGGSKSNIPSKSDALATESNTLATESNTFSTLSHENIDPKMNSQNNQHKLPNKSTSQKGGSIRNNVNDNIENESDNNDDATKTYLAIEAGLKNRNVRRSGK